MASTGAAQQVRLCESGKDARLQHHLSHPAASLTTPAFPSLPLVLSRSGLFVTLWPVDHQAPLSMEFSRQEDYSGLPFSTPGDLPNPGIKPTSPALAGGFLTAQLPAKPFSSTTLPNSGLRTVALTYLPDEETKAQSSEGAITRSLHSSGTGLTLTQISRLRPRARPSLPDNTSLPR